MKPSVNLVLTFKSVFTGSKGHYTDGTTIKVKLSKKCIATSNKDIEDVLVTSSDDFAVHPHDLRESLGLGPLERLGSRDLHMK